MGDVYSALDIQYKN